MTIDRVFDLYLQCLQRDFVPVVSERISLGHELPPKELFLIAKQIERQMTAHGIPINKRNV